MKSWKKPTLEEVSQTISKLNRLEHRRYFFDHLNNPEWIEPLLDKGFFCSPPPAQENIQQGSIFFPPWPDSAYLARMAKHRPELVCEIIQKYGSTDNSAVIADFLTAALNMPAEVAAKLIAKVIAWVDSGKQMRIPTLIGRLASHLAKGNKYEESLKVAEVLLDFSVVKEESRGRLSNEVMPKYDWYLYEEIIKKIYPDLVNACGEDALALLCRLLNKALEAERNPEEQESKSQDFSHIWRHVVESSNHVSQEIKDFLITGIVQSAKNISEKSPANLSVALKVLEQFKWVIFSRISFSLLNHYSSVSETQRIEAILIDDQYFDKDDFYHEYYELLKKHFSTISKTAQELIIKRISEKDFSYLKTDYDYPDDQVLVRREKWQIEHLEPIAPYLADQIKRHYDELISKHGDPEHVGFYSSMPQVWMGPESPISSQDLESKTPQELVEYLRSWDPPRTKMFGPSKRGLGQILDGIIAKDPEKYIPFIMQLTTVQEPTYISSTISGLRNAINQGKTFSWEPVIQLCLWVLENQDQIPPRDPAQVDEHDIDPDWTWTKHSIASLFYNALSSSNKDEKALYPFKDRIWKILEQLSEDPNPAMADEERYSDSKNYDSLAINSVRGEALQAVINYSLWQYRKLEAEIGKEKLQKGCFDLLPEVKRVLERHLDKAHDPLIAMHTVYGQWLPWIVLLDKSWAKTSLGLIFPTAEDNLKYRKAAWKTYIKYSSPYNNVFEVMKGEYNFWISKLPGEDPKEDNAKQLAQHLMTFYWRGLLELKDLQNFFELASPETRSEATAFMGLSLRREEEEIPEKILLRFRNFWEHRLSIIKKTFVFESHFHEIDAFAWWFESMAFDLDWGFQQLRNALELIRYPQHDTILLDVFKTLSADETLEEKYLGYMLDCLDIMIRSDAGRSRSQWWYWDAEIILEQVMLRVQDETVRTKAKKLINFIGVLGHSTIGKLLQISPKTS